MKLILFKSSSETICGEIPDGLPPTQIHDVNNPMVLVPFQTQQPAKIHGQAPQVITAFRFVPLPCQKIFVVEASYIGEVDKHDPVYVTFYKVLEARNKAKEDPLMITQ
jgi:hypothetical protein